MPPSEPTPPPLTYEAAKAHESNQRLADPIHWRSHAAYRDQSYRYLHHQPDGVIGHLDVRLVEARALRRSYWSALALGPVKLLGLSRAHGAVSSFCTLSLGFAEYPGVEEPKRDVRPDLKQPATAAAGAAGQSKQQQQLLQKKKQQQKRLSMAMDTAPSVTSPVIPNDDNPVWPSDCQYQLDLHKGRMPRDGQRVLLHVRVDEDSTAVEHLMPSGDDSKLLGVGSLDVTSLCIGQVVETGQPQVGVLDAWIPLRMNEEENLIEGQEDEGMDRKPSAQKEQSRVRVLVSYRPNGMTPQVNDVVALEAFARRRPEASSCRPVLPPLSPMFVRKISGPWLLVEYEMDGAQGSKGHLRVHRNTVFVIERKNIMDETMNLALLPADLLKDTPLGRSVAPLWDASRQLLMPAMLSAKLMWMAFRTTALASVTGVQAASSALWSEGSHSLTNEGEEERRRRRGQREREVNYKFVSL